MTSPSISTDDGAIQSGTSSSKGQLDSAMASGGKSTPASGVDPRLSGVVDDAGAQNRRSADRTGEGIERTSKDSAGKTNIDKGGAAGVNGVRSPFMDALKAAGASMLGGGAGGAAPAAASAPAPQMPPMPQVPAATAGQSLPMSLSNPAAIIQLAKLLSGDSSGLGGMMGMGGLSTLGGRGGAAGLMGPAGSGGNAFEQRILANAQQLVSARVPYVWGGGHGGTPGFSQGIRDGGAADMNGDYRKVGLDCSGLSRYLIYQATGGTVDPGGTSQDQYTRGITVSASQARPGDLVFSNFGSSGPQHVMVYVGDGKAVEAQRSGTNLMYSDVRGSVFKRYVSAG
jgi:hypothetical protein